MFHLGWPLHQKWVGHTGPIEPMGLILVLKRKLPCSGCFVGVDTPWLEGVCGMSQLPAFLCVCRLLQPVAQRC